MSNGALQDLADSLEPLMSQADIDSTAIHVDNAGEINGIASKTPVGADVVVLEDSAASFAKKKATLSAIPVAQSQVAGVLLDVASDGAAAILDTTVAVRLQASASGTKAITTTSSYAGQTIPITLLAASGGEYTLAVDGGTLTFDGAAESAIITRNAGNDAWIVTLQAGATIA